MPLKSRAKKVMRWSEPSLVSFDAGRNEYVSIAIRQISRCDDSDVFYYASEEILSVVHYPHASA